MLILIVGLLVGIANAIFDVVKMPYSLWASLVQTFGLLMITSLPFSQSFIKTVLTSILGVLILAICEMSTYFGLPLLIIMPLMLPAILILNAAAQFNFKSSHDMSVYDCAWDLVAAGIIAALFSVVAAYLFLYTGLRGFWFIRDLEGLTLLAFAEIFLPAVGIYIAFYSRSYLRHFRDILLRVFWILCPAAAILGIIYLIPWGWHVIFNHTSLLDYPDFGYIFMLIGVSIVLLWAVMPNAKLYSSYPRLFNILNHIYLFVLPLLIIANLILLFRGNWFSGLLWPGNVKSLVSGLTMRNYNFLVIELFSLLYTLGYAVIACKPRSTWAKSFGRWTFIVTVFFVALMLVLHIPVGSKSKMGVAAANPVSLSYQLKHHP